MIDPSGFSFMKTLMMVAGIVMSVFAPQFMLLWQQLLWSFASGYLASGGSLKGGLIAMATLGAGRWAGSFARAGPAGGGATPGFNPNALSLAETVEAAGGAAAETSTFDKIMEVIRRSVQNRVWEDSSGRTNKDRKFTGAGDSDSFARLYTTHCAGEPGCRAAEAGTVLARDPTIPDSVKIGVVGIAVLGTGMVIAGEVLGPVFLVTMERACSIQDVADGMPPGFGPAAKSASRVSDAARKIEDWLGPGARTVRNDAGDLVAVSRDGSRRVRFDVNRPYPHENPHGHVEELVNGRWVKSGPTFPKDVTPK